jgi:hypothetical protein
MSSEVYCINSHLFVMIIIFSLMFKWFTRIFTEIHVLINYGEWKMHLFILWSFKNLLESKLVRKSYHEILYWKWGGWRKIYPRDQSGVCARGRGGGGHGAHLHDHPLATPYGPQVHHLSKFCQPSAKDSSWLKKCIHIVAQDFHETGRVIAGKKNRVRDMRILVNSSELLCTLPGSSVHQRVLVYLGDESIL